MHVIKRGAVDHIYDTFVIHRSDLNKHMRLDTAVLIKAIRKYLFLEDVQCNQAAWEIVTEFFRDEDRKHVFIHKYVPQQYHKTNEEEFINSILDTEEDYHPDNSLRCDEIIDFDNLDGPPKYQATTNSLKELKPILEQLRDTLHLLVQKIDMA